MSARIERWLECFRYGIGYIADSSENGRKLREFLTEVERELIDAENLLFSYGAMSDAPCFCCGYNGEGYYQPDKHPCAERHHALYTRMTTLEGSGGGDGGG